MGFLFVCFLFYTYQGRSVCMSAWERIRFSSFLSMNSHEGSTRLPICSLLDIEFSHRVQKGLLLFLAHCHVNTYAIERVLGEFVSSFF